MIHDLVGIISAYNDEGLILTDKVIHLLRDATRTKICSIDLSHSQITDWSLQWLSQHPITRLGRIHIQNWKVSKVTLSFFLQYVIVKYSDRIESFRNLNINIEVSYLSKCGISFCMINGVFRYIRL
mgnify:CR=1 FL=1